MSEAHFHKRRWIVITTAFIIMSLIMLGVLISFSKIVRHVQKLEHENLVLIHENQKRISDIQTANINSCKTAFTGIRKAFTPFYPPKRTEEQQKVIDKFVHRLTILEHKCEEQFNQNPKKKPEKK